MKDISKGYIALYRQFLNWEWYDDANTMRLFIHCLLLANHTDKNWRGKVIKRGQFLTSQPKLANSLKLSIKQIRGSLTKLKTTGEVAVEPTNEYSIITIKNYDFYQGEGRLKDIPEEQKGQAKGRQRATTNNDNKEIDIKSNNISSSKEDFEKFLKNLKKEEEEELKNYSLKNKIKYFRPWLRKLFLNGDIEEIQLKAKKYAERQNQKQSVEVPPEKIETQEETELARAKYLEATKKLRRRKTNG